MKLMEIECNETTMMVLGLGFLAFPLFKFALTLLSGLRFLFYSSGNLKKYGKWAVITGATDGIGLGYAKEFSKRGFNLVLISRSMEKLQNVEKEIKEKSKVEIKLIAADFSESSKEFYSKILSQLEGLEIGFLINNVGVSYPYAQYFDQIEDSLINQLIKVNMESMSHVTKGVLQGMKERKRGVIINVGSAAGVIPSGDPLYAAYSASKAFVDFFSRSLNLEYAGKGIIVENHIPYYVTSKLSKIRNTSLTTPSPSAYASASISKIGYGGSVVPYWSHAIIHWLMVSLPLPLVQKFVWSHHLDLHKRAMKKLAKQQ